MKQSYPLEKQKKLSQLQDFTWFWSRYTWKFVNFSWNKPEARTKLGFHEFCMGLAGLMYTTGVESWFLRRPQGKLIQTHHQNRIKVNQLHKSKKWGCLWNRTQWEQDRDAWLCQCQLFMSGCFDQCGPKWSPKINNSIRVSGIWWRT